MARILQHFPTDIVLTGTDYNPEAVAWVGREFPNLHIIQNQLMPPWDIPPASQSVIYAVSIFTHLGEAAQNAWVAEIATALKPGGLFIFTVHGNPSPGRLLPAEQARFDAGQPVYRSRVKEGSRLFAAYNPAAAIKEVFSTDFDIAAGPLDEMGQTLWVMRKKAQE